MVISRRDFLATSATAASVAALGLGWAERAFAQDTADIRLAQIGFNSQGHGHLQRNYRNVVALCDCDEQVLDRESAELKEKRSKTVDKYTDFRKLLERKDIDAVSIATPNHTHAWIAVLAAQAGKHVYVEKPASHNIWEGRQMVQAARQNNRIMQCGTQNRSSDAVREAVEFVRSGKLGKINYVLGTCYKPRPSIGKLDKPLEIPSSVNYDLWCGPAAKEQLFRPRFHYDWHWNFNTGNGDMGNQGIHQMDVARWFLGEARLAPRVISFGGRLGYEDAGNTANTQVAYFDYPTAPLIFETRGLPRHKGVEGDWAMHMDKIRGCQIGVIVECENGYIWVPEYTAAFAFDHRAKLIQEWKPPQDAVDNHIRNFLTAVAANDPSLLHADIREGHVSSALCHMGNTSYRLGKPATADKIMDQLKGNDLLSMSFDRMASHLRANGVDLDSGDGALHLGPSLELDPETEMFTGPNADTANELRARKQRDGYAVPDLERSTVATRS